MNQSVAELISPSGKRKKPSREGWALAVLTRNKGQIMLL
jgi:hypothetical protein